MVYICPNNPEGPYSVVKLLTQDALNNNLQNNALVPSDTFASSQTKPSSHPSNHSILDFLRKDTLEKKWQKIEEHLKSEFNKRNLNSSKTRLNIVRNVKDDTSYSAAFNFNSCAILVPDKVFEKWSLNKIKGAITHETVHASQISMISCMPEKNLLHFNKLTLQETLLKNKELKNALMGVRLSDIDENFISKFLKEHPGEYLIETQEDMKYAKNELVGLKMLLENFDIDENKLPMSLNLEFSRSLRNNRPLNQDEIKKCTDYVKSKEESVKRLTDIENGRAPSRKDLHGNEMSNDNKQEFVYFEDLMEDEAFDAQFDYLKSSGPVMKLIFPLLEKYLKQKNSKDYYILYYSLGTILASGYNVLGFKF